MHSLLRCALTPPGARPSLPTQQTGAMPSQGGRTGLLASGVLNPQSTHVMDSHLCLLVFVSTRNARRSVGQLRVSSVCDCRVSSTAVTGSTHNITPTCCVERPYTEHAPVPTRCMPAAVLTRAHASPQVCLSREQSEALPCLAYTLKPNSLRSSWSRADRLFTSAPGASCTSSAPEPSVPRTR